MTSLAPYRQLAEVEEYIEPVRPKYGLIKKTGNNPWKQVGWFLILPYWVITEIISSIKEYKSKHRCGYPKCLSGMLSWIGGSPIAAESVYRCSCGKFWMKRYNGWDCDSYYERHWKEAGGEL